MYNDSRMDRIVCTSQIYIGFTFRSYVSSGIIKRVYAEWNPRVIMKKI